MSNQTPEQTPEHQPTRKELFRPASMVGLSLLFGAVTAAITMYSAGVFTESVNRSISMGTYQGLTPLMLGLVMGGIVFIVSLLVISMLILAINPADITRRVDRPVLWDEDEAAAAAQVPSNGAGAADSSGDR